MNKMGSTTTSSGGGGGVSLVSYHHQTNIGFDILILFVSLELIGINPRVREQSQDVGREKRNTMEVAWML